MNPPNPGSPQQTRQPLSDAAKSSLLMTHNLFRTFIVTVLGAFFVFQLDINLLWLAALLTVISIVLGIALLVRAVKLKESRLVLFGTISGLVVSAVMVLLILPRQCSSTRSGTSSSVPAMHSRTKPPPSAAPSLNGRFPRSCAEPAGGQDISGA
ncbi:hypothetical protein AHiyo6_21610 [Arthrobacter sp. Hiyo6]|nr:hypothetical protein AHiyo6_21610 [Arthrobacter sp. Hiyo6]